MANGFCFDPRCGDEHPRNRTRFIQAVFPPSAVSHLSPEDIPRHVTGQQKKYASRGPEPRLPTASAGGSPIFHAAQYSRPWKGRDDRRWRFRRGWGENECEVGCVVRPGVVTCPTKENAPVCGYKPRGVQHRRFRPVSGVHHSAISVRRGRIITRFRWLCRRRQQVVGAIRRDPRPRRLAGGTYCENRLRRRPINASDGAGRWLIPARQKSERPSGAHKSTSPIVPASRRPVQEFLRSGTATRVPILVNPVRGVVQRRRGDGVQGPSRPSTPVGTTASRRVATADTPPGRCLVIARVMRDVPKFDSITEADSCDLQRGEESEASFELLVLSNS